MIVLTFFFDMRIAREQHVACRQGGDYVRAIVGSVSVLGSLFYATRVVHRAGILTEVTRRTMELSSMGVRFVDRRYDVFLVVSRPGRAASWSSAFSWGYRADLLCSY